MSNGFGEHSRLWLCFSIRNFKADPDQITKLLGQKPTRVLKKGKPVPNGRVNAKFNSWTIHSKKDRFDLEGLVNTLLKKLRKFKSLHPCIGKFDASLTVILEVVGEDTRPAVSLTAKQLQALGEMGIVFSVDYYFF